MIRFTGIVSGTTQLTYSGTSIFGDRWTIVAVEDFGSENGGKQVILKHSTGRLLPWTMSDTWARNGELPTILSSDISAYNAAEVAFNVNFNGDEGIGTGLSLTPIESTGVVLNQDSAGNLYAGNDPIFVSGTSQLTTTYFGCYCCRGRLW